jgi:ERCC4-related helicase
MTNNGAGLELEQTIRVKLDPALNIIRNRLTLMMLEVQREIRNCGYTEILKTDLASVKSITALQAKLLADQEAKERLYVLRRIAKFFKLYRLLQAGMTECYETLVEYGKDLRQQAASADENTSSLAQEIISDSGFKRVEAIAIGGIAALGYQHPKVEALINQCRNLAILQRQGIIFVGNRLLGQTLAFKLNDRDLRATTLMGAHANHKAQHNQASQRFLSGEAKFLVCTSVLESKYFPDIQAGGIICYTLPQTPKSKKARQDHTAKDELAFISNLVADHSPDGSFWLLKRQIRQQASEAAIAANWPAVQTNLTM